MGNLCFVGKHKLTHLIRTSKLHNMGSTAGGTLLGMFTAGWLGGSTLIEFQERECEHCHKKFITYTKGTSGHLSVASDWQYYPGEYGDKVKKEDIRWN